MSTPNFAKLMDDLNVMSGGITTRLTSISSIGITAADATALAAYAQELKTLNNTQEDLKAQLKTKTAELEAKIAEAKAKHAKLSKMIKVVAPQSEWLAFGITAKK